MSSRPLLFFSHANSFPAGTYRKMLGLLSDRFRVEATDRYGHDARFPVTDCWPHLVQQAAYELDRVRKGDEPVVLVGHSLGGFLSLMLAAERPAAVNAVVMLDSPIVAGWKAGVLKTAKRVGLAPHFPPAAIARRRRDVFGSPQEAFTHFSRKRPFVSWDDGVLSDYVNVGIASAQDADGSATLRFDKTVEAAIYQTVPHSLGAISRRLQRCTPRIPVGFVYGTKSTEMRRAGLGPTRRLVGEHLRSIADGSHLFPMEHPDLTASYIIELLDGMLPGTQREAA